jgi:hypothetical protein
MSLKGTLKDFSVSDIFQLIAQQRKSGALVVSSKAVTIRVYFASGQLIRADIGDKNSDKQVLGQMLLRAGLVGAGELRRFLAVSKKTLVPLEKILLEEDAVPARDLLEFARLRTRETVNRLFALKEGLYEFEPCEVIVDPDLEEPLGPESFVMDAYRSIDEWPSIKAVIPVYNMTFSVNAGASTGTLSDTDLRILNMIREDDRRDVQKLIDLSRLGEFETCRALFNLSNAGVISGTAPRRGRKIGSTAGGSLAESGGMRPIAILTYAVTIATFLACALLFGRTAWSTYSDVASGRSEDVLKRWAMGEALAAAQKRKLDLAIQTWRLTKGTYPPSLDEMVAAGWLEKRDVRYPWKQQYTYYVDGTAYVLMDPPY